MISRVALALLACVCARTAVAQDEARGGLLSPARIATLPPARAAQWRAYIATSRRLHDADTAAFNAELRSANRSAAVKAPYASAAFEYHERPEAWFQTDSARALADAVLTFQTPSGGWSKRTDMTRPREPGMNYYAESAGWSYIPTLDNGATTGQLRFLARMFAATGNAKLAESYRRGLSYLLSAQQPNGCWPQSFPLEGEYHDAITFNDDVVVSALQVLDEAAAGSIATAGQREKAAAGAKLGVRCLVAAQVRDSTLSRSKENTPGASRRIWGQQHDPITYEVIPARKYELAGLAGKESAAIMRYLMTLKNPSPEVIAAVHGAAAWFKAHAVHGYRYDFTKGLEESADSRPIWPRLTEISTGKAIFANRDGVKLYDWHQLTDRRTGYAWYGTEPAEALRKYEAWRKKYP